MRPLTCIIVEDELEFVEILNFYLNKIHDIRVLSHHTSTAEASVAIEKDKPDFVLLDVSISGDEGPDFINKLTHQPKVIIISGHTEGFMKYYPNVKYVDFLQKPPSLEKLATAIDKCR
jgi:two-component SAPR family response regulator